MHDYSGFALIVPNKAQKRVSALQAAEKLRMEGNRAEIEGEKAIN
jgi:hypothetical protein